MACPAFDGPEPFGYNSANGRFNAIGPTDLNGIIFAYSTFGDAQLFEEFDIIDVPALSDPMIAVLAFAFLAIGATWIRSSASSSRVA